MSRSSRLVWAGSVVVWVLTKWYDPWSPFSSASNAIEPIAPCGRCRYCGTGDYQVCVHGPAMVYGVGKDGGMAEEILNLLTQAPDLKVIFSPSASLRTAS